MKNVFIAGEHTRSARKATSNGDLMAGINLKDLLNQERLSRNGKFMGVFEINSD